MRGVRQVNDSVKIKRALFSVYDKSGIVDFAKALHELGVQLISTGGTHKLLREQGIPVTKVSDITDFPEILGGRVKTLHPRIHGGILARRTKEHLLELKEHGIQPIDMVVVNLYPFEKTIADPNVTLDTAVENIDIGGPTMIRAAAKNFRDVVVVTDPQYYDMIIDELKTNQGTISFKLRHTCARQAFLRTAYYDSSIYQYLLSLQTNGGMPEYKSLHLKKIQELRYGENPHQKAAFYAAADVEASGVVAAKQLHGKELSYNNIQDMNGAIGLVLEYEKPAVAIIKHSNPCGAAVAENVETAYDLALSTDPVSAFGGIVAMNRQVTRGVAEKIIKRFTEVVVAPDFSPEAVETLQQKKNIRLIHWPSSQLPASGLEIKAVEGGILMQELDLAPEEEQDWKVVTKRQPTEEEWNAMKFGWKVGKWVKSNAVVYVNDRQTLGIGAGQMSRVDASKLAVTKAGEAGLSLAGSVVISDAFFPFRDGVDAAAGAGAVAVIQPGGSVRDEEVINAADEHNMAMVFTGRRHFRH